MGLVDADKLCVTLFNLEESLLLGYSRKLFFFFGRFTPQIRPGVLDIFLTRVLLVYILTL